MPEKDGDDDKKSTKSVVNKKQKQIMNQEDFKPLPIDKMYDQYEKKRSANLKKGPYGDVKTGTKFGKSFSDTQIDSRGNSKQTKKMSGVIRNRLMYTEPIQRAHSKFRSEKNDKARSDYIKSLRLGEEGYDHLRDMGKVRPSKDKKDATTLPVSDEVKKTQKVNKGPSAFERVKAKYGKSVMNVGKKKANEELDLTQVAEALGGYIVEAPMRSLTGDPEEITSKIKKAYSKTRKTKQDTEAADQAAEMSKKRGEFAKSFGGDSIEKPERLKTKMAKNIARQDIEKTGDKFVGGSKSGTRKKKGIKFGDAPGAGPVKIIQPAKTKAEKEAELEGKRKDYLDPKTNKASPEGVKKYITKARQMRSGSNVPVDQETTDNIAKIAGKEYEDKINQKYGGRRAGKRKSTATPPAFATRTGESGGPLPVSMRNRRVPKTSSIVKPTVGALARTDQETSAITKGGTDYKALQDKIKTVTPEIVGGDIKQFSQLEKKPKKGDVIDVTATRVNGTGAGGAGTGDGRTGQRNIFTGEPEPPKDETKQRQFKPDPNYIKPPKGFNPDQLELDFNQQQQQQLPPSQEKPDIDKLLDRTRKKKFSPSFIPTMEIDRNREPKTQTDDDQPPVPPKPTAVGTGGGGGKRKFSAFNSIRKFAKDNPAVALAAYDTGKGILSKIMKLRAPSVQGGRAIQVSAKQ